MEEEVFISELHGTMHDLSKAGLAVPKCEVVRVQCVQPSEVYPLAQLCVRVGRGEGGGGVVGAAAVWEGERGGGRRRSWGCSCVGRGEGEGQ